MVYRITQVEPYINMKTATNLIEVMNRKWFTEGTFAKKFVKDLKKYIGAKHLLLTPNGTLSIYLALCALDVHPDDQVIIPDFTFNASASPVAFLRGEPVFVDVRDDDFNIDYTKIEEAITPATKVIMPVHIYGQCCDMKPILDIAKKYDIKVLEDAAEALGVKYKGLHAGTIGDVGVLSFFADKTLTTGEGGAVLTNDDDLEFFLRFLRNQGRERSGSFKHPQMGMNFRLNDLGCAVGCSQLDDIDLIVEKKRTNYNLYKEYLCDVEEVRFIEEMDYSTFVPFRVPIRVADKKKVIKHLEKNHIQTREMFFPLHRQPCFGYLGYKKEEFPVANRLFDEGICLPVHTGLNPSDIEFICNKIKEALHG